MSATATRLYVCVTCRTASDEEPRAGARLFEALAQACADDRGVDVVPVECLSVCKRPCTVSFAAPGKWTYVYGDLPADTSAAVIRDAARLYGETADGLIPWRLRADPIKKGVVARVPPLPLPETLPENPTLPHAEEPAKPASRSTHGLASFDTPPLAALSAGFSHALRAREPQAGSAQDEERWNTRTASESLLP